MQTYSKSWDASLISSRFTNNALASLNTPAGRDAQNLMRSLGELESISDLELSIYSIKAKFQNADTLASLTLVVKDGAIRVDNLSIEPVGELRKENRTNALKIF